ncbi:hypothetical protein A8C56_02920 [Niabella ginsenosidivorans]|uniref:Uncharacterized protein n=1 Tax=Niabella ginsenosidivorans TaxID=1176587 RepID=A0A1A9HXU9_9BACT|nr:hypothetical protein [Niabella ginsenosidivorans]ANH80073.1 hypothetical protein A8C56_02920 [Niabella ginsenosidivorans]
MMQTVIHIHGVKVKGRTLINRQQLCEVLGIKSSTFSTRVKYIKDAQVETPLGVVMYDVEKALSIKLPKTKEDVTI